MAYAYTGTVFAAPLAERDAATSQDKASLFTRLTNAIIASRMRSVRQALRSRGMELDENGVVLDGLNTVSLDEAAKLPFAR
jgi:hypothetical protein